MQSDYSIQRRVGVNEWRALGLLFVVSLFNYLDRALLSVLQVPIKRDLALTDAQLGSLTGLSFALFYATAAVPLARLVDRVRRTWLIAASLVVWTSMTALSALASSFLMLVICRIGVALGEAGSVPATHSLLSDYFPRSRRGTVFSVWAVASPLGAMLGIALAGKLSADFGWRTSFAVIGILGFVLVPFLLAQREPLRGQFDVISERSNSTLSLAASLRVLWNIGSFRVLVLATSLHTFTYTAIMNWTPAFLARVHELALVEVAAWSSLMIGGGGAVGALCGGIAVDLLARRDLRWYGWAPGIAALVVVPAGLVQYFSSNLLISLSSGFLSILSAGFFIAPVNALAQSMVTSNMRGLTSAVLLVVPTIFGLGLGPFLTGVASDIIASRFAAANESLRYAMALALCGSALGCTLYLYMAKRLRMDLRVADARR